jgi:hypothetical protein
MNHIKTLDPNLHSFVNINSKEDLYKLPTRNTQGVVKQDLKLNLGAQSVSDLQLLQKAADLLNKNRFDHAQYMFGACMGKFDATDSYFWAAVSGEKQGKALFEFSGQSEPLKADILKFEGKEAFLQASNYYRIEAQNYEKNRCLLLEERALADKTLCESWVMDKPEHTHRYPSKVK